MTKIRIEFVMGVEWLAQRAAEGVPTIEVNYEAWMRLTKEQKVFVLEHERLHEMCRPLWAYHMPKPEEDEVDWFASQDDGLSHRDSEDDECPLCGQSETCVSCGPKDANELAQLREERVQLQRDIAEIGAEYAALRNAVVRTIAALDNLQEWELGKLDDVLAGLKALMEK